MEVIILGFIAACIGLFMGFIGMLFIYPVIRHKSIAPGRRLRLFGVFVSMVLGGGIFATVMSWAQDNRKASGGYPIGLLVGAAWSFVYEERRTRDFVDFARKNKSAIRIAQLPRVDEESDVEAELLNQALDQLAAHANRKNHWFNRLVRWVQSLF